eukprot:610418-Pleurochrysis_carterae.AAC.2
MGAKTCKAILHAPCGSDFDRLKTAKSLRAASPTRTCACATRPSQTEHYFRHFCTEIALTILVSRRLNFNLCCRASSQSPAQKATDLFAQAYWSTDSRVC